MLEQDTYLIEVINDEEYIRIGDFWLLSFTIHASPGGAGKDLLGVFPEDRQRPFRLDADCAC